MNTIQTGITILLRSGITGEKLLLPEGFSMEAALPVLKNHSVVSLAYEGAVNCGLDTGSPVMQRMMLASLRLLMAHEKQARDLESIFVAFQQEEIPFLPMKGCNLKKLYPKPELRPMGDADILIRVEDYPRIRPVMERLGFTESADTDHSYHWHTENLEVELHKNMVRPAEKYFFSHYGTGWQLAETDRGCRYRLSREEEYAFAFVHLTKHYRSMGIGLRHFVDLYVYRRAWPDLDMDRVCRILGMLDLSEFHANVMDTLEVWFSGKEETPATRLITEFVFASGNWGQMDTYYLTEAAKSTGKHSGPRSVLRALFPQYAVMCRYYSVLTRWAVLLPVFWIVRWFAIVLFRRKTIRRKLRILRDMDDDEVRKRREALRAVGLELETNGSAASK